MNSLLIESSLSYEVHKISGDMKVLPMIKDIYHFLNLSLIFMTVSRLRSVWKSCAITLFLCVGFINSVEAEPNSLKIKFDDRDGLLNFKIEDIEKSQVSISLSDERFTLLKIMVDDASIPKKYWIRGFKESRSDKDIKGIMVRQVKKSSQVEIRVRYRSRISQAQKSEVKVVESDQGVKIITPRQFKSSQGGKKESVAKKTPPKPSLDPKLTRIKQLSSSLNDDTKKSLNPPTSTSPTQARPSVFERGAPTAPLPRMDSMRSVQTQMTTPPKSQIRPGSQQGLKALPVSQGQKPMPTVVSSPVGVSASPATSSEKPKMLGSHKAVHTKPDLSLSGDVTPDKRSPSDVIIQSKETSDFELDETTELIAYLMVFVLLMWLATVFLKRGKGLVTDESDTTIRVISQKVVNLNPRQRIMVIETKGHTIVVGACDRGGLSQIAHLSTPLGPVGAATPSSSASTSSSLDALGQLSGDSYHVSSGYYPSDERYVSHDEGYHQPVMAHEESGQVVDFEENTFVGDNDEDVFTVEMPVVSAEVPMERDRMMDADSYSMGETPRSMAPATASQMSTPPDSLGGFSADEDEEVKPENLLQLIQKLNSSKG